MKRHLFLTGPIGCGKSTAIRDALGVRISRCGGLLTRRHREPHLHFTLDTPDGANSDTFLDFSTGKPEIDLEAFSGVRFEGGVLVLDEIGGIELLNPDFATALEQALSSTTPILGVVKGPDAAGALMEALGLTQDYERAASRLWTLLLSDADTLVYECEQFDEHARLLAAQWAEEYLHDELL